VAESFAVTRTAIANFVLMPWPSRGRVAAWLGDKASKDAITTAGQGAIRALLAGAKASLEDSDKPTIFVGHIELGAARTDAGQPIAGHCDIEVATEDLLELGADFYALGHIHVPQTIAGVIRYSGSPRQKDFGEALGHGYTIWEEGEIRHVELPSPRWITVDAEWKNGAMVFNGEANPTDIVRLRYSVPEPERAAAAEAAMRFGESFSRFKSVPEIVSGEREMRSEVRSAHTPEEKLAALWESKKNRPERAKEILAKLASVHV
jgi:DNA repair exonuclease SbcCD nuclease subunit